MDELTGLTVSDEEYAWALYAQEGIRSPSKLRARLLDAGRDVPRTTIDYWIREKGWAARFQQLVQDNFPGIRAQTMGNVVVAAHRISERVLAAAMEDEPPPADFTKFAALVLDRAGLSPVGQDRTAGVGATSERRGLLAHLTDEDVERLRSGLHR